ncbi:hypothetical protein TRIP_C20988 [Candidatus Zixiibacteriota bacterium]|nr:hypothetical protein TRIP_C20988 [candidate division Zixibacteria bacterium]
MNQPLMPDLCNRRYPFHYTTALCLLIKLGIDISQIEILAIGEFENYKGEILWQEPAPGAVLTADARIRLKVGYPSAIDFMPYQFFYGLAGSERHSASWEEQAREILAPFDSSVIRHNAAAEYHTLKFNLGLVDRKQLSDFLQLFNFELSAESDEDQKALIWTTLMPFFHFWAGNGGLTEKALELIFGYEFDIIENTFGQFVIPEEIRYILGSPSGRLGRETVLGNRFHDYDSNYEIIIKGISSEEVRNFLPGGLNRKRLDAILRFCMPNHLDYRLKFEVKNKNTIIGRENRAAYLGYAAHI